jgi:hypothetical protein
MAKMAGKRLLIVIPAFTAVLVVAGWTFCYHSFEFKGGISIHDSGFFSYPRFRAELAKVPLWKDGEYRLTVSGLPSESLDLELQVVDATYADTTALTSSSASVAISIADTSGHPLCTVSGKLSDARLRGLESWVLESSSSYAAFWHSSCQQLPISRFRTYVVSVTVSGADDREPHRSLVAVLRGGGNELP